MKAQRLAPRKRPRPQLHQHNWLHEIMETAALVLAIYSLVNLSSARYMVQGQSMFPNFDDDQVLYVSRLNYLLSQPERLDIVVFHYPNDPQEDYIKRVIGLPGDVVEIRDARVYVNNTVLNEPYLNESCDPDRCTDSRWHLAPDEYFVLGDNRNHSNDSRVFGPVKRDLIVGEVLVRYWPPQDWGIVTQIGSPAPTP